LLVLVNTHNPPPLLHITETSALCFEQTLQQSLTTTRVYEHTRYGTRNQHAS
jgi:hypothetical protein